MTTALYLVASTALLVLFGIGPARTLAPGARSIAGVVGIAYGLGALLLTLEALVFSAAGIPWSLAGLSAPLLVASGFLGWRARSKTARAAPASLAAPFSWATGVVVLAGIVFAVGLANSSANSVDFVLIYGVKAVLFALYRGISPAVLAHPLFIHAAPRYPPLMPVVESWGVLVAGGMPWRLGPAISFAWYAASVAAIGSRLRQRLDPPLGDAVAAYWASALALSFCFSYSGGNAEVPLVFFVSVAATWILTEAPGESRWLPAVLLAGAALSKQEGLLAALALAAGTYVRDALQKRPGALRLRLLQGALLAALPLAGTFVWFGFERLLGLPVGYRPPGPVFRFDVGLLPGIVPDLLRNLDAGTWGLVWALPLGVLIWRAKRVVGVVAILPVLVASAAVTGALLATYLAPVSIERAAVIARTLPRACQPVLSLLILGAGICSAGRSEARERATGS